MKELFRVLLKNNKSVVKSEEIYKMFPDLNENAVQSKIKRCLRGGELQRLYKGVYVVNTFYTHKSVEEEQVAHAIDNRAYLSGLAALRFHNLIPDVINFKTFFGTKSAKINTSNICFEIKKVDPELTVFGIEEIKVDNKCFRVAEPVRAIFDTFLSLKISPKTRRQICAYLRIEDDDADSIDWNKARLYVKHFRNKLALEIASAMASEV
jgi:predicted transcriptional regulator of viral defense system